VAKQECLLPFAGQGVDFSLAQHQLAPLVTQKPLIIYFDSLHFASAFRQTCRRLILLVHGVMRTTPETFRVGDSTI
jgi:hypothetical protein